MRLALALLLAGALGCRATEAPAGGSRAVETELRIRGNDAFSDGELERVIALDVEGIGRRSSPKSAIDDAAYSIVEFYRSRGFPDCSVRYDVRPSDSARVEAELTITEGPRTRLVDVDIAGAEQIRRSELLELLRLDDLDGLLGPRWFVESEILASASELADVYVAAGFADVRVATPVVSFDARRETAKVVFTLVEGPRVILREIAMSGGVAEVDSTLDFRPFAGQPRSPRRLYNLRALVEEAYAQNGYPDVEIELVEGERDARGGARIELRVRPGTRVRISELVITGNEKTRRSLIERRVTLEPGDLYDVRKVRDSFRALNRSGLFRRVRVELAPGGGEERALRVELEEATTTEIYFEPGFGSYEGARALAGIRESNLFGTGRTASLEGLVAERAGRVALGLSEPRLFGSHFSAGATLFDETREEPSFDKEERGASLVFSHEQDRELRSSFEYRFRQSLVSNVDVTAVLPADVADVDISSVILSATWDERDSIFQPRSGNLLRASIEFADESLGSELDFFRWRIFEAAFFPLGDSTVLGLAWRAGVITPIGRTDVIPIQERFFNGGENSVRSFEENELGPQDAAGEPLGGEAFHIASLELRRNLIGELDGALFYDAGTLVTESDDFLEFGDARQALGTGLRYQLPIGPIRVDWGWNPNARSGEDTWVLHFSVGMSF